MEIKFTINSSDLKDAMERVASVINKNSAMTFATYITLWTKDDSHITVTLNDIYVFCDVTVPATVEKYGCVFINANDVKKIYNIPGEIKISSDGHSLVAKGIKKGCEIATTDVDNPFVHQGYTSADYSPVMEIENGKLMNILERLYPFVSCDESREVLTGFYFDCDNGKIVALDGFRMGVVDMAMNDVVIHDTVNFNVCGERLYSHLKKLIRKSDMGSKLSISRNEKIVLWQYSTPDYALTYGIYETKGNYVAYNKIIPLQFNREFRANTKEIKAICKEYKGYKTVISSAAKGKIDFVFLGDNMFTYISDNQFRTYDNVESYSICQGSTSDAMISFNVQYILDCMSAYDDCDVWFGWNSHVAPMVIKHDDMMSLILPIRQEFNEIEDRKSFIINS